MKNARRLPPVLTVVLPMVSQGNTVLLDRAICIYRIAGKFGGLAVYITTAKLKSAKIFYSHILYVWQSHTEPPNLNLPIFLAIRYRSIILCKFSKRDIEFDYFTPRFCEEVWSAKDHP